MVQNIRSKLTKIKTQSDNRLEQWLIDDVLNADEPEVYLKDIINIGCQNGIVGSLIYYKDIYPFFQNYYLDIQEVILNYQQEFGVFELKADIQSHLTWIAVEYIASELAFKLCIE